jgi:hypothetical protein
METVRWSITEKATGNNDRNEQTIQNLLDRLAKSQKQKHKDNAEDHVQVKGNKNPSQTQQNQKRNKIQSNATKISPNATKVKSNATKSRSKRTH